jgi:hypothetical protein
MFYAIFDILKFSCVEKNKSIFSIGYVSNEMREFLGYPKDNNNFYINKNNFFKDKISLKYILELFNFNLIIEEYKEKNSLKNTNILYIVQGLLKEEIFLFPSGVSEVITNSKMILSVFCITIYIKHLIYQSELAGVESKELQIKLNEYMKIIKNNLSVLEYCKFENFLLNSDESDKIVFLEVMKICHDMLNMKDKEKFNDFLYLIKKIFKIFANRIEIFNIFHENTIFQKLLFHIIEKLDFLFVSSEYPISSLKTTFNSQIDKLQYFVNGSFSHKFNYSDKLNDMFWKILNILQSQSIILINMIMQKYSTKDKLNILLNESDLMEVFQYISKLINNLIREYTQTEVENNDSFQPFPKNSYLNMLLIMKADLDLTLSLFENGYLEIIHNEEDKYKSFIQIQPEVNNLIKDDLLKKLSKSLENEESILPILKEFNKEMLNKIKQIRLNKKNK